MMSGWEPVLADIARRAAFEEQTNPHWKWSMTDENGLLLHYGHTQRRPTPTEAAFVRARDRVCKTKGCRQPSDQMRPRPPPRTRQGRTHPPRQPRPRSANRIMDAHRSRATRSPSTPPPAHTPGPPPTAASTPSTLDDDLNLTADLDNPHPSAYRQPTLPDETLPDETLPDETLPDETLPDETLPRNPARRRNLTKPCSRHPARRHSARRHHGRPTPDRRREDGGRSKAGGRHHPGPPRRARPQVRQTIHDRRGPVSRATDTVRASAALERCGEMVLDRDTEMDVRSHA